MTNPVVVIRAQRRGNPDLPPGTVLDPENPDHWVPDGRGCWIWCPGCDKAHRPVIAGVDGERPEVCWEWNGHDDEHFGIEPSLLVDAGGDQPRCHSFIRAGHWQFLSDCGHQLAGQTVPMVPLPDWLAR